MIQSHVRRIVLRAAPEANNVRITSQFYRQMAVVARGDDCAVTHLQIEGYGRAVRH